LFFLIELKLRRNHFTLILTLFKILLLLIGSGGKFMKKITLGLAGGYGGKEFHDYTLPMETRVKEVHVFSAKFIDAIQIAYVNAKGNMVYLPKIGGLGGNQRVFVLDDEEYITGISGRCGWYIDSLRIHTNRGVSDTFGGDGGTDEYRYNVPKKNEFAGFFGRADWHLDAIGIISREKVVPIKVKKTSAKSKTNELELIEGIGPKIASILVNYGINNLKDLSQTKVEKLKDILDKTGPRYKLADPTTWSEQAALGVQNKWEALKEFQEKLKGGRLKK
jgi:hypothetical protein